MISCLLKFNKVGITWDSSALFYKAFGYIIRSVVISQILRQSMMEDTACIFFDWPNTGCIEKQQVLSW